MASSRRKIEDDSTWRERVAALRYVPSLLGLVWQTHRAYTMLMLALRLSRAFVPVASLWVAKLIIDRVIIVRGETTADAGIVASLVASGVWRLVALEVAIVLVGEILSRASSLVESLLGDLFSNKISIRLMEHAATLDLYQFENPAFYDSLERARRQTTGRIGLLTQLFQMMQDAVTLASLAFALVVFNAWLLVLLTLAVVPSFLGATHYAALEYSLLFRWTPERRMLDYLRFLGASDRTAKEVQMFNLAPWLVARYEKLSTRFYEENKRLSIRRSVTASVLSVVGTLGYYGAYVVILAQVIGGAITIGSLTFLAASFARSRDLIERLLAGANSIYTQALYLKDLFAFFETRPTITAPANARRVPQPIREGFRFENVGFRYPEAEQWAVRGVNFTLNVGERIALVGENGAGKTTLTKLLARLYDPTEGRITLDGIDLREYDIASLRESISIIFQDFVRYDLAFDANIGVGSIEGIGDYLASSEEQRAGHGQTSNGKKNGKRNRKKADDGASGSNIEVPERIVTAADKSLAASLLPRLSEGYGQMLGRRFDGGVDLSGGEWQKIALARSYIREAQILILDEPTAALDARAEYEVFNRFSELVTGRMAVLISHRFSTVRMADRIIVLQNGAVAEEGTHDELVAQSGLYAELFKLQAAGYR
ncbi:MAG: ABC transporter ATP-binding protein/permease [Pyrinomonadaceae bacterium MAG19_C2-C3]|nr:ABC transporter ATP-binding protein/permease [Pyrinomonadaceae bacterium MAG19_C2-C3]